MRIGIVLNRVPGYSETFFRSKIKGLAECKHEVFLFAGRDENDKTGVEGARIIEPAAVSRLWLLQVFNTMYVLVKLLVKTPKRLIRFVRLEHEAGTSLFGIIKKTYINSHIIPFRLHWLYFGFSTVALDRENVAAAIDAKMAAGVRGYDISIYSLKNPGCYNRLWKQVDKMHVISDSLRDKVIKNGYPEDKPIIKITPAIDYEKFFVNRDVVKRNGVIRFTTIGRLNWKKGYEYSLSALKIIKQQGCDFIYNIIGGGEEYERIKFAAYQLGVLDNVRFMDALPHNEVIEKLRDTEIYLQPSVQEGFCNATLEAQAAGCLCIVSDAEGLPENVLDEKTGWVVPKRDVAALADKIEYVTGLPEQRKSEVVRAAQKRIKDEFNIEKQIKEFIEFYEN